MVTGIYQIRENMIKGGAEKKTPTIGSYGGTKVRSCEHVSPTYVESYLELPLVARIS